MVLSRAIACPLDFHCTTSHVNYLLFISSCWGGQSLYRPYVHRTRPLFRFVPQGAWNWSRIWIARKQEIDCNLTFRRLDNFGKEYGSCWCPSFQWCQVISSREINLMKGRCSCLVYFMMTSSNGNIFRVAGHLCGEFTCPGEFPAQRPVTRSFDVFFDLRLIKWLNKQS